MSHVQYLHHLTHIHRLTRPIHFGTQAGSSIATHVGIIQSLPPPMAMAFWGPGFKNTLFAQGYMKRNGLLVIDDPLRPTTHSIITANINGRTTTIDNPQLNSINLLDIGPHLLPSPTTRSSPAALSTPATRDPSAPPRRLTIADTNRLNAAEALHIQYHHVSDAYLADAIRFGAITTIVTPLDIHENRAFRGPCPSCLNAKLKELPHPPSDRPKPQWPGQQLTLDVHQLEHKSAGGNTSSIRCLDALTNQFHVQGAKSKSNRDILAAIIYIIAIGYNKHGHVVETIFTDSEAVLRSLRAILGLMGITLILAVPLDHARLFERHNQTIVYRARATLSGLDYILPPKYEFQLIADVAHATNCVPNKQGDKLCPHQMVTGKPPLPILGTFGAVYIIASSVDQRKVIATNTKMLLKSVDKGVIGVCLGHDPLWPDGPQFLLANGQVVTRRIQSPALAIIPFGFTPKTRQYAPLPTHAPPAPAIPSPPVDDTPISSAPTSPAATTPPPTSNSVIQPGDSAIILKALENIRPTSSVPPDQPSRIRDFAHTRKPHVNPFDILKDTLDDDDESAAGSDDVEAAAAPQQAPDDTPPPPSPAPPIQPPIPPPVPPPIQPPIQPQPTRPPPGFTKQRNPQPPPSPHQTRSRRLLNLVGAVLCAVTLATSTATSMNAVQRKAHLKSATMSTARAHLRSVAPAGVNNRVSRSDPDFSDLDYELNPPFARPDEISLTAARTIVDSPTADPILRERLQTAIDHEMHKTGNKYNTFRPITASNPIERDAIRITSLMFIKFKRDGRITARLAGCGNQQPANSYGDISASTSDHITWKCTLAAYYAEAQYTNSVDRLIHKDFDVPGAFLNERLPRSATGGKQIIMRLPKNLPHPLAGQWVEVIGALYGLKQSNHLFEVGFAKTMASIGFYPPVAPDHPLSTPLDVSVYHRQDPTDPTSKVTVVMHVDDGQIFGTHQPYVDILKTTLEERYGPLTWNDVSTQHTGTQITRHHNGAVSLHMTDHIVKTLHKLGMDNVDGALTPSSPTLFHSTSTVPTDIKPYQRIVGDLIHISRDRLDITKEVQDSSRHSQSPTIQHLRQVVRILRYLKTYPATAATFFTKEGPILCGHVDTAFANQDDGTSTTGANISIGSQSAPFFSKSYPQDEPAIDPCTSEYYGLTPITRLLLRFRHYLAAIGFPQRNPTPIYVDNLPAIKLALAVGVPRKSRYIHARHHFIKYCIANHLICLVHRNTNIHSVDIHTKPHGPTSHHYLTALLMNSFSVPTTTTPHVVT